MDSPRLDLAEAQRRRVDRLDLALTSRAGLTAARDALGKRGWVESKYKRGGPGNRGQFASKPQAPDAGAPVRMKERYSSQQARQMQDMGLRPEAPVRRTPGDTAIQRLPTPTLETVQEVIDLIPAEVRAAIAKWPPDRGPTAKAVLGQAATTRDKHLGKDGKSYNKARAAYHQRVVNRILEVAYANGAVPKSKPTAHLLAGGPGVGKTTMVQAATSHVPKAAVNVDVDELRYLLPEYQKMIHPGWSDERIEAEIERLMEMPDAKGRRQKPTPINHGDPPPDKYAAAGTHDEALDMRTLLLDLSKAAGLDVVIDGTGDGDDGWFADTYIAQQAADGYAVHVHYADAPVNQALHRSIRRAQLHGRWLAPEFIAETAEKVGRNVSAVLDSPHVSALTVHDVSKDFRAELVADIRPGAGTIRERLEEMPEQLVSPSQFNDFVARYDSE